MGAFGDFSAPDNNNHDGAAAPKPLMAARPGVEGHRVGRAAAAAAGAPPFLAHELCREIIGVNPCDRRRPTAEVEAMFPGVSARAESSCCQKHARTHSLTV